MTSSSGFVTQDEMCVHYFDPDTKQQSMHQKRQRKLTRGVLFLQDNTSPHTQPNFQWLLLLTVGINFCHTHPTQQIESYLLAFHLFPYLKAALQDNKYENNNAVIAAVEDILLGHDKEFYRMVISKLEDRSLKCIARKGDYFET
uniref:Histone-lysine N-methyltransferase SETMAR n=1 Tax=Eptatretus burgeri TaxID=7764 RepID=A0A8C4WXH6_EPTBU